jgi:hypothetical protein
MLVKITFDLALINRQSWKDFTKWPQNRRSQKIDPGCQLKPDRDSWTIPEAFNDDQFKMRSTMRLPDALAGCPAV